MLPEEIYAGKSSNAKFEYSKNSKDKAKAKKASGLKPALADVRVQLNDKNLIIAYNNSSENSLAVCKKITNLKFLQNIGLSLIANDMKNKSIKIVAPAIFNKRSGIKCSKWLANKFSNQDKKTA